LSWDNTTVVQPYCVSLTVSVSHSSTATAANSAEESGETCDRGIRRVINNDKIHGALKAQVRKSGRLSTFLKFDLTGPFNCFLGVFDTPSVHTDSSHFVSTLNLPPRVTHPHVTLNVVTYLVPSWLTSILHGRCFVIVSMSRTVWQPQFDHIHRFTLQ